MREKLIKLLMAYHLNNRKVKPVIHQLDEDVKRRNGIKG